MDYSDRAYFFASIFVLLGYLMFVVAVMIFIFTLTGDPIELGKNNFPYAVQGFAKAFVSGVVLLITGFITQAVCDIAENSKRQVKELEAIRRAMESSDKT